MKAKNALEGLVEAHNGANSGRAASTGHDVLEIKLINPKPSAIRNPPQSEC